MSRARTASSETEKAWAEWRRKQHRQPAGPAKSDTDELTREARDKRAGVETGCTMVLIAGALSAVFGLYAACQSCWEPPPPTPVGCSAGGGEEWAVWDAARDRRRALEDRANRAVGFELDTVRAALIEAAAIEDEAYRAWQRCMGR